jgi:hypothetical protein
MDTSLAESDQASDSDAASAVGNLDSGDIRFQRSMTIENEPEIPLSTTPFGSTTLGTFELAQKKSLQAIDPKNRKRVSLLDEPPSEAPPPRPGTYFLFVSYLLVSSNLPIDGKISRSPATSSVSPSAQVRSSGRLVEYTPRVNQSVGLAGIAGLHDAIDATHSVAPLTAPPPPDAMNAYGHGDWKPTVFFFNSAYVELW